MRYEEKDGELLRRGGVGVMPTDTLYGLVASALSPQAVGRVYALKRRSPEKPFIILIADIHDLGQFGVALSDAERKELAKYWPGSFSVVLPVRRRDLPHLRPKDATLAFRLPDSDELRDFLRATGPLVAPSANPEGKPPATTISEAKEYFGSRADFYADGGTIRGDPSTVLRFANGKTEIVRD